MMSYGSRLVDLRRSVMQYIYDKVKEERAYKLEPGDLFIFNGHCYVKSFANQAIDKKLEELSVETLCAIADKIHFRPLGGTATSHGIGKREEKPQPILTQQTTNIGSFEIKKDIPLPGQVFDKKDEKKIEKKRQAHTNYRALPLKELNVGECIIVHESNEEDIAKRFFATKAGVAGLVNLMDTKKKFVVAKTHDFKVGVWRVE
jgi:nitrate/TMAO reductase-like tetraheme cytochrome c subunit